MLELFLLEDIVNQTYQMNPELDLVLEKTGEIKPELVWKAWTTPKLLMDWFCPKPWKTVHCEIDLRPGGAFKTTMQAPDGTQFPTEGCYLEIVEGKKLVWTSALLPGYRPLPLDTKETMPFTAMVTIEPSGAGTKLTAVAIHRDRADRNRHEQMGFHEGWGICFDQLVEAMKGK